MSAVDQHAASEPARQSPDEGDTSACNCGGAWHEAQDHCVSWTCPGCDYLCPTEPGVPVNEDDHSASDPEDVFDYAMDREPLDGHDHEECDR